MVRAVCRAESYEDVTEGKRALHLAEADGKILDGEACVAQARLPVEPRERHLHWNPQQHPGEQEQTTAERQDHSVADRLAGPAVAQGGHRGRQRRGVPGPGLHRPRAGDAGHAGGASWLLARSQGVSGCKDTNITDYLRCRHPGAWDRDDL